MKHGVLLLLLTPLGVLSSEALLLERTLDAMGSTYTVALYGEDSGRLEAAADAAFEEVRRLDRMLSNYKRTSEWSRVNQEASAGEVKISAELFRLLAACRDYSRQSEGTFDITVGPLMKVWGFYKGSGRLPHRAEIRGVLTKVGWQKMILDPTAQTVRFEVQGMEIDPGGIGKGYAIDRMVAVLKEQGIRSALVNAGGSSIYAIGTPPHEPGWRIKLRHPRDAERTVEEILLKDESMSTSGSYEKFFRAEGRIYSHIMNPRTGYPAQGVLSVSVVAPRTLDSEAWTKPFFIQGRQWAEQHRRKEFRVFMCEDRLGTSCAWLQ